MNARARKKRVCVCACACVLACVRACECACVATEAVRPPKATQRSEITLHLERLVFRNCHVPE
eukprot:1563392-Alexandrium_andersonii.AAC.1